MALPTDVKAKVGDLVLPKWLAFLKLIDRSRIVTGEGIRISDLPGGGTLVSAIDNYRPWSSPFKVSATASSVNVAEGLVNGVSPSIEGIRLDGTDADGLAASVPTLEIDEQTSGVSYIAVRLTLTDDRQDFDSTDPDALKIVHITELPRLFTQGGSVIDGNTTDYPLAALYWDDAGGLDRVLQIVHHNLNHRYVAGAEDASRPDRHLFWAA